MNWKTKIQGSEFKVMRLQEVSLLAYNTTLDTPERAAQYLRVYLPQSIRFNPDAECFGCILLNTRRRPIGMEVITNGTLDTLLVHAREVFRSAIIMSAAAIVLFHNHPSGEVTPSEADVKVTRDLIKGGQLLKIDILDHIILGRADSGTGQKDYCSLRELGYFYT